MPNVALITCAALPDLYVDDTLLVSALDALGIRALPAVWSRDDIDWTRFDALVIRSPWDYFTRVAEFRSWLDARIASGVLMCNTPEILTWNFDKSYLRLLAAAGVELVPTIYLARGERPDIASLARDRGWDEIVVKPTGTLQDRGLLVQPFLPEILSAGELSLLFFDGVFSHAVRKRPAERDYRVQVQLAERMKTSLSAQI
jgi:hypothetical protein